MICISSSREIEASVSDLDAIDQYVDKLLSNDAPHVTKDTAEAMKASLRKYFQKVSADKIGQFTDEAQAVVEKTLKTLEEARPGQTLTTEVGTGTAAARTELTEFLEMATGAELPAKMNMDFFLRVAKEVAFGAGRFVADNGNDDLVQAYPALELVRFDHVFVPRGSGTGRNGPENGWGPRWEAACDEAGDDTAAQVFDDTGRMVALRDSDVWQSLGDGAGGYDDTLGNPFAPFAWNSGYDTKSISRKETIEFGLMDELDEDGEPTRAEPADVDFENLFSTEAARCLTFGHLPPLAVGASGCRGGVLARFDRFGSLAGKDGSRRAVLVPFRRRLLEAGGAGSGETAGHEFRGNQWTLAEGEYAHGTTETHAKNIWKTGFDPKLTRAGNISTSKSQFDVLFHGARQSSGTGSAASPLKERIAVIITKNKSLREGFDPGEFSTTDKIPAKDIVRIEYYGKKGKTFDYKAATNSPDEVVWRKGHKPK